MKYLIFIVCAGIILSSCSGKKTPQWMSDSHGYLEQYKISRLTSTQKESSSYKQKALLAVKQSGMITSLQLVELTDAAMDTALLQDADFTEYEKLGTIESSAANRSYKAMLTDTLEESDLTYLSDTYLPFARALYKKEFLRAFTAAKEIDNDISKLIALGILVRSDRNNTDLYEAILDVSKRNGYRNVTIRAMGMLQFLHTQRGSKEKADQISRTLEAIRP